MQFSGLAVGDCAAVLGLTPCTLYVQIYCVLCVSDYCCRKTAVCNGDQLLDFSLPELVRSQSKLSTDPKVLQNCTGFTLSSSAGLAVGIVLQ